MATRTAVMTHPRAGRRSPARCRAAARSASSVGLDRGDGRGVEVEEPVQRGGVARAVGVGGELLHAHGRRVQQRLHGAAQRAGELVGRGVVERRQAQPQPLELGLDDVVGAARAARARSARRAARPSRRGGRAPRRPRSRERARRRCSEARAAGQVGERVEVDARDAGQRRPRPRRCRAAARGRRPPAAATRRRSRAASARSAAVRTRPVDPVQDTTMSAFASSSPSCSRRTARPPTCSARRCAVLEGAVGDDDLADARARQQRRRRGCSSRRRRPRPRCDP